MKDDAMVTTKSIQDKYIFTALITACVITSVEDYNNHKFILCLILNLVI